MTTPETKYETKYETESPTDTYNAARPQRRTFEQAVVISAGMFAAGMMIAKFSNYTPPPAKAPEPPQMVQKFLVEKFEGACRGLQLDVVRKGATLTVPNGCRLQPAAKV